MLLHFRVENYLSFNQEQKLALSCGPERSLPEHVVRLGSNSYLRTAAIFGANASGKTNLVTAMADSQRAIVLGVRLSPHSYCRTDPANRGRLTSFEYGLALGSAVYAYGFAVDLQTATVAAEWLIDNTRSTPVNVFLWKDGVITTELKLAKGDRNRFEVYATDAAKNRNALLLTRLAQFFAEDSGRLSAIAEVHRWFRENLRIIMADQLPAFVLDSHRLQFIGSRLPAYDTGITGIEYLDLEPNSRPIPQPMLDDIARALAGRPVPIGQPCGTVQTPEGLFTVTPDADGRLTTKQVVLDHGAQTFSYAEESDGTDRLFQLMPITEDTGADLTYVVDEIDRSLHPQLTQKLVGDFERLDPQLRRQLIMTTHESRLMDQDLLRRDEIWFVKKDAHGDSSVYSLEEFNERTDRKIDKAYLSGRYGGIPCFREAPPHLE